MSHYNQILSLARSGNPVRAWERFIALGLGDATTDIKTLTLKGRLLKDRGNRAVGEERLQLYREASQAYLAANALKTDSYPLINAATLALLSQDQAQARELARQVLTLIEGNRDEGETPYWREATRAEALLVLVEVRAAEAALAQGIARLPHAWEDHAATIGQFERILAVQGEDPGWLDAYRPAASVHFSGLIGLDPDDPQLSAELDRVIAAIRPGFAFGPLAAGADIMIAEKLIDAGASLHVTLPFGRERFRELSVEPFGEQWEARFDALIEAAEAIEEMGEGEADAAAWLGGLVDAGNLAAMGRCLRRAEALRSRAHAIAIAAQDEPVRGHIAAWQQAGLTAHVITTRRTGNPARFDPPGPISAIPAILALRGGDPGGLASLAAEHGLRARTGPLAMWLSGGISACLAAVAALRRRGNPAAGGLVITPVDTSSALRSAEQLATRLAQVAGAGGLYAEHQTAMIALVLDPASRVEGMGEVGTLAGSLPVYAIVRR